MDAAITPSSRPVKFFSAFLFGTVSFVLMAIACSALYIKYQAEITESFSNRLLKTTEMAAMQIDGDIHAALISSQQETSPEYNQVKTTLLKIRQINPDFEILRTLRLNENGVYVVVDAESAAERLYHMMDPLATVAPASLVQIRRMSGAFVDQTIYTDAWNQYRVVYVPVYTSGQIPDAILMVGVPEAELSDKLRLLGLYLLAALVLAVLSFAMIGFFYGRALSGALNTLAGMVEARSAGMKGKNVLQEKSLQSHPLAEVRRLARLVANQEAALPGEGAAARSSSESVYQRQVLEMHKNMGFIHTASSIAAKASTQLDHDLLPGLVVEALVRQFEIEYAGIFLINAGEDELILRKEKGKLAGLQEDHQTHVMIGEGLVGLAAKQKALQQGAVTYTEIGENGTPTERKVYGLALPMVVDGRVFGAILLHSQNKDYFSEELGSIFQAMADQVAVAFRNALFVAEKNAQLENLRQSYQQLTQTAWENLLSERGSYGYRANEAGIEQVRFNQAASRIGENRSRAADALLEQDDQFLKLPVQVRGQVIGFLAANRTDRTTSWSDEEIELLNTLVRQLSVALDNARLYSATQLSAERERILSDITGRVRASTSVDVIMQTAVRQLTEALKASRGTIQLRNVENSDTTGRPAQDTHSPEDKNL